ncbi:MAG TPA: endonuclease domain-containing protein, partial [Candidatus Saccharimonadales bacterium]
MTTNNKERAREYALQKKYGLTLEDYKEMLSAQDGVCYICEREPTRTLCVDHVHINGYKKMNSENKRKYVRGLLCFMCNTALKGFEKTADGIRNRKQLEGS